MIYTEPSQLGWRPYVDSWLVTLPHYVTHPLKTIISEMCDELVNPGLNFVRKHTRELIETSAAMRVNSLLRFLTILLKEFEEEKNVKVLETWVKGTFLFAYIWSLGGALDGDSRGKFDQFVRGIVAGTDENHPINTKFEIPLPDEGTIYDYLFEVC